MVYYVEKAGAVMPIVPTIVDAVKRPVVDKPSNIQLMMALATMKDLGRLNPPTEPEKPK